MEIGDEQIGETRVIAPRGRLDSVSSSELERHVVATLDGGAPPYDYVERVEITDIDDYRRELARPEMGDFSAQWSARVGESIAVFGDEIA